MSDERFDCIIVGGGLAGLTAAYVLAGEGLEVLLIERGNYSGSKNITGGRLYGHSLDKVIADFAADAPVERRVVKERFSDGVGGDMRTVEYNSAALACPSGESYTVLRGKFDRWLADKAEEQGAMLISGVRVDSLLKEDGKVYGVVAGDEEMEADVVILADGVNSLLAQELGYKAQPSPSQVTVGVKEVIGLSQDIINQRFNLSSGEGLAWMFCGGDQVYDAFLYTNTDSLSIGVTMAVDQIDKTSNSVPQMLEDFKNNPQIAPLLEGGRLLEYGAHLIPEGGEDMLPRLYGDGVLLAGDAAALCANLGFTLRGMDLAVESGLLAARAVLAAKELGDFSSSALSAYEKALRESYILNCVKGGGSCREALKAGDYEDDPPRAFNNIMNQAGIR